MYRARCVTCDVRGYRKRSPGDFLKVLGEPFSHVMLETGGSHRLSLGPHIYASYHVKTAYVLQGWLMVAVNHELCRKIFRASGVTAEQISIIHFLTARDNVRFEACAVSYVLPKRSVFCQKVIRFCGTLFRRHNDRPAPLVSQVADVPCLDLPSQTEELIFACFHSSLGESVCR